MRISTAHMQDRIECGADVDISESHHARWNIYKSAMSAWGLFYNYFTHQLLILIAYISWYGTFHVVEFLLKRGHCQRPLSSLALVEDTCPTTGRRFSVVFCIHECMLVIFQLLVLVMCVVSGRFLPDSLAQPWQFVIV